MAGIILGGTAGGETLTGTSEADSIYGNGGNDRLYGGAGNDSLFSGEIYNAATGQYLTDTGGDMFFGEAGNDKLTGSAGNDTLDGGEGDDIIDGGAGWDTAVYAGARASLSITVNNGVYTISSATAGTDTVSNVERLRFADVAVAFDINGHAGDVYRLYQAAFDRKPDAAGLGYWINSIDNGNSMVTMASAFATSAEYQAKYGANTDNSTFLTNLYNNVLHRAYDQGGFDYWLNALNTGFSREQVLAFMADSAENRAQVIGSIQAGIEYTPWAG
jgi:Ca2+-binding RTX toxin-like protein